jgi:hypothetical protein
MNGQVGVISGSTGGIGEARQGYLEPSDAPGIGVDLNEEKMTRHPYGQDKFLRLFEEGWERRER